MTILSRVIFFLLVTVAWWSVAVFAVFAAILPCGMGPDDTCGTGSPIAAWVAVTSAVIGYLALSFILIRRWSR